MAISLFAFLIATLYSQRILEPWKHYIQVRDGNLFPHPGDLFPRWIGTRDLLLHGQNPYGPAVSGEIQTRFYGHPIIQSYSLPEHKIIDEQRFAYPIYVVFFLAPTVYLSYGQLEAISYVALSLFCAASVFLWIDFLKWRLSAVTKVAVALFVLSTPQIMQALRLRQLSLAVGLLIALTAWCIARNHLATAGVILAIATIKPQLMLLPLAWIFLWTSGDLGRRWRLLAAFVAALSALVGAGELLLPGWVSWFLDGLRAYRLYFPTYSILEIMLGNKAGDVLAGVFILWLAIIAWKYRRVSGDSGEFALVLALSTFVAVATMSYLFMPFNQALLLPPSFLLLRDWQFLPKLTRVGAFLYLLHPSTISLAFLLIHHDWLTPSRLPLFPLSVSPLLPLLLAIAFFMDRRYRTCR